MKVFLNPHCAYGTGLSRWKKIEPELRARFGDFEMESVPFPDDLSSHIASAIKDGECLLVAAGGDGTVNLLLNAIMNPHIDSREVTIGAIGLGSSNDFHKPFDSRTSISGVPARLNPARGSMHDVIRIEHGDSAGGNNIRYALINVSVGVVAEANGIYNSRYKAIQLLRRFSCEAAIAAAALAAVFTYRNMRCTLSNENGRMRENSLTNLGIIKNPHFAGSLCYDTPVNSSDGKLRVNLCAGLSLSKRIGMLVSLYGHRFSGLPGTMSWLTEELTIESHQEFALEMDGEIVQARKARISVIPRAVRCCQ